MTRRDIGRELSDLFPGPRPLTWHQLSVWEATLAGQTEALAFGCEALRGAVAAELDNLSRRVVTAIRRHQDAHCPLCHSTENRPRTTPTLRR